MLPLISSGSSCSIVCTEVTNGNDFKLILASVSLLGLNLQCFFLFWQRTDFDTWHVIYKLGLICVYLIVVKSQKVKLIFGLMLYFIERVTYMMKLLWDLHKFWSVKKDFCNFFTVLFIGGVRCHKRV